MIAWGILYLWLRFRFLKFLILTLLAVSWKVSHYNVKTSECAQFTDTSFQSQPIHPDLIQCIQSITVICANVALVCAELYIACILVYVTHNQMQLFFKIFCFHSVMLSLACYVTWSREMSHMLNIFNFEILNPLKISNATFGCKPISINADNNIKQKNLNSFFANILKQYLQHLTWLCDMIKGHESHIESHIESHNLTCYIWMQTPLASMLRTI